jgi:hypothetical protein
MKRVGVAMRLAWQSAVRNAALMLVLYIALDLLCIRLGLLHRIGWFGAIAATIFIGWMSYARASTAVVETRSPNDR